ncbi:MAG: Helicase conserved C-terminal domain-containing protein [uncultured Thiotrichaceae bacterium]|uniref:Helicase conserved C-terminal domain-containing protein n=1 Tax=uncultured Thiotrichaceae bacterium TaxID=298394 RepID=A0A6S6TJK6_9GAMM|nr:MAG: Helicase conserved C-terminal domain-containing protein [uncultured Thiotrichaceae bacterium]
MKLTIARHCVENINKLSPLQQALLDDPCRVRIADAPTGAGKTYAFQQALLEQNARILFIVPTRRLAQNIASGLMAELKQAGWPESKAQRKVAVWNSDETLRLKEEGVTNVNGYRVRQISSLDNTSKGGEMIVAIPEVVSHLLLTRWNAKGIAGIGVFDVLADFDHIVFDEFHTIEARGFGLASLFAKLASVTDEETGNAIGQAKVSLLSATPLKIDGVLKELGIAKEQISILKESIVPEGRALHGDVELSLHDRPNMLGLIKEQVSIISQEVNACRQVVVIYNALGQLQRDLLDIAHCFNQNGIDAKQVLVVNSIDDTGREGLHSCGFAVGQKQDPDSFSVLIATASVEMGVTFRDANVMLMEPGFAPMNFLQRYGRAARRDKAGQVMVRIDSDLMNANDWIRELNNWMQDHQDTTQTIHALSKMLSKTVQMAFDSDDDGLYFGELSKQAIYTSGLFWYELLKHSSNKKFRGQHLYEHQPKSAKRIAALIKTVRQLEQSEEHAKYCEIWLEKLREQALQLRDIGKRVKVIESSGRVITPGLLWLQRETVITTKFPVQSDDNGNEYFQLYGELHEYFVDKKNQAKRMMDCCFPHRQGSVPIEVKKGMQKEWSRHLHDQRDSDTEFAWEDFPDAMKAADDLVRLTGLIPGDESDVQGSNRIF